MLLEWLSEAEQTLRFRGALPDDTESLQSLIDTHKVIQPQGTVTLATHRGEGCPTTKGKQPWLVNFRPYYMQRNRNRRDPACHLAGITKIAGNVCGTLKIVHSFVFTNIIHVGVK